MHYTHTHTTSRKHTNTRTHIHTKMLFNWHLYRQTSYLNWTLSLVPSFAGHPVTVTRWECLFSCNTTKPHEVNSPTNHPLHYTLYMISCSSLDSTHNSSTRQQWALVLPMAIPDRLPYIVRQTNKQTSCITTNTSIVEEKGKERGHSNQLGAGDFNIHRPPLAAETTVACTHTNPLLTHFRPGQFLRSILRPYTHC